MDDDPSAFGAVLRRFRTSAALSQEVLAERAGLSLRGVSDLERGVRRAPHLATLGMLADALELSPTDRQALVAAARPPDAPPRPNQLGGSGPGSARLPHPLTSLIGREQELARLFSLLADDTTRLVTLTGPGGAGKTRLALEVGSALLEQHAGGVVFIDLAPLSDATLVLPAIASTLGVREPAGQRLLEALTDFLDSNEVLLLLDNCEHVLEAVPEIASLLVNSPGARVLATSREPLRVRGERIVPLAPLPLPDPAIPPSEALARNPAVMLFLERAQAAAPGFPLTPENAHVVAAIVRRLDGLPLAIELAAAWVKLLPPAALLDRLTVALPLLTGGSRDLPTRQRTLRDTIAWSYDLLSPQERMLFRCLAVFVGGWTIEAAEAVADPSRDLDVLDGVGSLLDKSLIRVDEREGESRYGMLETVREFALDRLEREGEREAARARHAAHFLRLAERGAVALEGIEQRRWLRLLEREHPNLREAFATFEAGDDDAGCLRLATALYFFWFIHTRAAEGLPRLRRALDRETGMTAGRARALVGAGYLAYAVGDYADAERWLREGEVLARALGDTRVMANARLARGTVAEHMGDEAGAERFFHSALSAAQEVGDAWLIGVVLPNLSDAAYRRGDLDRAERFAMDGFAPLAESGNGYMESMNLANVAQVALARGDIRRAAGAFGDALGVAEEIGSRWNLANAVAGAAAVEAARGRHERSARLLGAADAAREASGHPRLPQFFMVSQTEATVRRALGPDRFRAGWAAGRALPAEAAADAARAALAEAAGDA